MNGAWATTPCSVLHRQLDASQPIRQQSTLGDARARGAQSGSDVTVRQRTADGWRDAHVDRDHEQVLPAVFLLPANRCDRFDGWWERKRSLCTRTVTRVEWLSEQHVVSVPLLLGPWFDFKGSTSRLFSAR